MPPTRRVTFLLGPPAAVLLLLLALPPCPLAASFGCIPSASATRTLLRRQGPRLVTKSAACSGDGHGDIVAELFRSIDDGAETVTASIVAKLEQSYSMPLSIEGDEGELVTAVESSPSLFVPLLGLYAVSAVLTAKAGDNPVGGKWTRKEGIAQKLLRTRATYQHLLPAAVGANDGDGAAAVVAEAVNVISLEALFGLIRLTVILRGDATPLTPDERLRYEAEAVTKFEERGTKNRVGMLSPLAVRADFDPPRIIFGKRGRVLNLNLGPRSGVVLDTTYCDDKVRVGKGGTSGTRFVFRRIGRDCREGMVADEWRALLSRRPLRKSRALLVLGSCLGWGLVSVVRGKAKVVGSTVSTLASLLGAVVLFGSGGIERDNDMNGTVTASESR